MVYELPFLSVIMPIRNEEKSISDTLNAIITQDYNHSNLEILIADGNSSDNTRSIIYEIAHHKSNLRIRLIDNPGEIFATGFNLALPQAKGDMIIMLGGHTEIAPDYITECVNTLDNYPADCVGGTIETIAETYIGKGISAGMGSKFGVGGVAFRTGINNNEPCEVDTVAFGAYRREIIEKIGMMDEELVRNQDDEFNYRLRANGGRIWLSPAIRAKYYSRSTLQSLWNQYYQYGFWKVRVLQKHPWQMRPRQFVPPLFVLSLLVSALIALIPLLFPQSSVSGLPSSVFSLPSSVLTLPLIGMAGVYLLANLTASFHTASKKGWRYLPLLLVVFAILHISYGLGFLVGLVKFWNRWGDKVGKVPEWKGLG